MKQKASGKRYALFAATMAIFLAGFLCIFADGPEALGAPRAELNVYQDRIEVEMTEAPSTEIEMNGTVSVAVPWSPDIQVVEVNLDVVTEGYNWIFDPPVLVFENDGEKTQHFDLKLSIPKNIPAGENMVEIGGFWTYSPGALGGLLSSDNVILEVSVFQDGEMDAPMDAEVKDGRNSSLPLVIRNTGNVDQDYLIILEGKDTLENIGVDVEIEGHGHVHADMEETVRVDIGLNASGIDSERTYYLVVKLQDMGDRSVYDHSTIAVDVHMMDEPSSPGTTPSPGPIDDGDERNNDPVEEPEDIDTGTSGGSRSGPALFYFIEIVLVIGILSAAGIVYVSRSNK